MLISGLILSWDFKCHLESPLSETKNPKPETFFSNSVKTEISLRFWILELTKKVLKKYRFDLIGFQMTSFNISGNRPADRTPGKSSSNLSQVQKFAFFRRKSANLAKFVPNDHSFHVTQECQFEIKNGLIGFKSVRWRYFRFLWWQLWFWNYLKSGLVDY